MFSFLNVLDRVVSVFTGTMWAVLYMAVPLAVFAIIVWFWFTLYADRRDANRTKARLKMGGEFFDKHNADVKAGKKTPQPVISVDDARNGGVI